MMPYSQCEPILRRLAPLNRVHNGPDLLRGMDMLTEWVEANGFRGRVLRHAYPAGAVYNHWRIPARWTVRKFSLRDAKGTEIVGAGSHPLCLTPFSDSFSGEVSRAELLRHIHTRDDLPEAIPFMFRKMYRHWEKGWGIALPHRVVAGLTDERYQVEIETVFEDEPMPVWEYRVEGSSNDLIQLPAHFDHPGQANDSLSGVIGALWTVRELEARWSSLRYGYSVLACPEIVGTAAYLCREKEIAGRIRYCLCPNMLAHDAPVALCLSKSGQSMLDRALRLALLTRKVRHVTGLWHKYPDCGDEISYDAPGLAIPTSTISRVGEQFRHYHTSLDTPDRLDGARFEEAVHVMADALGYLDRDAVPRRTFVGNPCLANPEVDLYLASTNVSNRLNPEADASLKDVETGEGIDLRDLQEYFLSNLEGRCSLIDLAYEARVPFEFVADYAARFEAKGLVTMERANLSRTAGLVVPVSLTHSEAVDLG